MEIRDKGIFSKLIYCIIIVCMMAFIESTYAASGLTQPLKPRYGGTLRVGEAIEGISIGYPAKLIRTYSIRQVSPVVETLLRTDKTGKPIPWLATAYTENAAAKVLSLTLRKNVKFHDGTDFNAEAVKWNLGQCIAAKTSGTEKVKSIEVIDNYTIRINLTEWDSSIISSLTQNVGMMVSPTGCTKNGEEWCARNPIGTGPFRFVSWEKDVRTVYQKFDGYWQKGKPYLDRIEWIPMADTLTRQLSFRRKELDVVLSLVPQDLAGLEKDGYGVMRHRTGSGAFSIVPDAANPKSPFADIRVRRAVAYAIDNAAVVKTVLYGEVEPTNQYLYKGHWGYNTSVVGYPYNPRKAKQLLAEAGYPNGFKTKLAFLMLIPQAQDTFVAVQGYLTAVGIDVELEPLQIAKFDQIMFGGTWEGLIYGPYSSPPDPVVSLVLRYAGGKSFSMMLLPSDYLKAIQNAVTASNFETKQKWIREVGKLMIDKYCLLIPIYCTSDFVAFQTYVHNHGFIETPNSAIWTPEDVWLEER
jgi:peptide/nickel transport system substrate-binding protein